MIATAESGHISRMSKIKGFFVINLTINATNAIVIGGDETNTMSYLKCFLRFSDFIIDFNVNETY